MSRERDAIEEIWKHLQDEKLSLRKEQYYCFYEKIEQILTQMEDLIQEDLTIMESSCRSRETLKTCPLLEEYKKSQEATNTKMFWQEDADFIRSVVEGIEAASPLRLEDPAEGDILSDSDTYSPI